MRLLEEAGKLFWRTLARELAMQASVIAVAETIRSYAYRRREVALRAELHQVELTRREEELRWEIEKEARMEEAREARKAAREAAKITQGPSCNPTASAPAEEPLVGG